jgi:hypothetical protein
MNSTNWGPAAYHAFQLLTLTTFFLTAAAVIGGVS